MEKEFVSKKGKKILFRRLVLLDLEQALVYINNLSREDTFILYSGETITKEVEQKYLEDAKLRFEYKTGIKIGAFHNGRLIATSDITKYDKRKSHVGLVGLSVAKDYREEGIGTALMSYVLELGKDYLGVKIATLGVFANNPKAQHVYEKLGFQRYGVLPEGLSYKGGFVDHVFMYKKL